MTTAPAAEPYYRTLYNLSPEEARLYYGEAFERYYTLVSTVPNPPDVNCNERDALQGAVLDVLLDAHDEAQLTTDLAVVRRIDEPYVNVDLRYDRTLPALCSLHILTPTVLERLQTAVRAFPLWRLVFDEAGSDEDLVIYPDRICLGSLPPEIPLEFALADWLPGAVARIQQSGWYRNRRRQFWRVKPLVAAAFPLRNDLVFLTAFDHSGGHYGSANYYSAWFLQQGQPKQHTLYRLPGRSAAHARSIAVDEDGQLAPRWSKSEIDVYLVEWSFAVSGRVDRLEYVAVRDGVECQGVIEDHQIVRERERYAGQPFWPFEAEKG